MVKFLSPIRIFLWAIWCAGCISFAFIASALTFSRKTAVWLQKNLWAHFALRIPGGVLHVTGKENVDFSKPHIYISNHQSYMDIPAIMTAVDAPIYFVAKKELTKIPFLGWFLWLSDMILIDRSNRSSSIASLKDAAKQIHNGKNVILFPEGTRSKTGKVNEFKKGAFMMALDAQVPVVPIAISGTERVFPPTKLQFKYSPVYLHIGEPISTEGYNSDNVTELMQLAKQSIEKDKVKLDQKFA